MPEGFKANNQKTRAFLKRLELGTNFQSQKSNYTSNETPNIEVFFDNLQVTHVRGPVLEESHYYPFGLVMKGISSKALNGIADNKYKFTSQLLDDEFGLSLYQMRFRNQDPQIGRFIQIDPLADQYVYNSIYAYAENDVIRSMDLEGLEKYVTVDKKVKSNTHLRERTIYTQVDSKGRLIDQKLSTDGKRLTQSEEMYRVDNFDDKDDKGAASLADKFIAKEGIIDIDNQAGTSTEIQVEKNGKEFAVTRAIQEGEKIITSKGVVISEFKTGTDKPVSTLNIVFDAGLKQVSKGLNAGKNTKLALFVEVNPKDRKAFSDSLKDLRSKYSNLTIQIIDSKDVEEKHAKFTAAGTVK